jgi:rfaE bifunctional protein nucleotidyltransferase chain/domain|tara:strand:+ start:1863 stop:2261 length:399 start_codon:yes stop_codon:yes gene_type:complete
MEEKIIWTNGCFDVLHVGHIELFKYAKDLGSKLYVGIDSDEKVKRDKGDDRPFNKLSDRIKVLESIRYIDKVISFDSTEGLENLVGEYKPHVLIVGSDWKDKTVVGEQYAQHVRFFDRIEGYSTTNILEWKE